jgi:hypothetical protein
VPNGLTLPGYSGKFFAVFGEISHGIEPGPTVHLHRLVRLGGAVGEFLLQRGLRHIENTCETRDDFVTLIRWDLSRSNFHGEGTLVRGDGNIKVAIVDLSALCRYYAGSATGLFRAEAVYVSVDDLHGEETYKIYDEHKCGYTDKN